MLAFEIIKKETPLQGSQVQVDLFGNQELVGFYNTFVPKHGKLSEKYDVSIIPERNELIGIKGKCFTGY